MVGRGLRNSVSANFQWKKRNKKEYEVPWDTFLWHFLNSWEKSKSYLDMGRKDGELLRFFCNEQNLWACPGQTAAHWPALVINSPGKLSASSCWQLRGDQLIWFHSGCFQQGIESTTPLGYFPNNQRKQKPWCASWAASCALHPFGEENFVPPAWPAS